MREIILLSLIFIYYTGFSQDTTSKKENQISFKAFAGWRMNDIYISSKEFKNEIYKVPAAIPPYKKGTRNNALFYVSTSTMAICLLLSRPARDISSPRFGKENIGFAIAGLISAGFSFHLLFRSKKQLKEAVRIHNENQPLIY